MGGDINNILCSAVLDASMTNADIEEYMRQLYQAGNFPTYFTISGFDSDPRNLWEIPEAVALMNRMWECGFVSLLHANVAGSPEYFSGFFGAMQLWGVMKGIVNQEVDLDDNFRRMFVTDYTEACQRGNRTCCPHDGQNRTSGKVKK